jgi:hypothetical protein
MSLGREIRLNSLAGTFVGMGRMGRISMGERWILCLGLMRVYMRVRGRSGIRRWWMRILWWGIMLILLVRGGEEEGALVHCLGRHYLRATNINSSYNTSVANNLTIQQLIANKPNKSSKNFYNPIQFFLFRLQF